MWGCSSDGRALA